MTTTSTSALGVLELRRYVMQPGRRDELIALFESEFIESQERCGMIPAGHYRDLDDPHAFVWFRVFENMELRRRSLEAFYLQSPVWREHRDAANATLVDSDNVLLLRPARPDSGFNLHGLQRGNAADAQPQSLAGAGIFMLTDPASHAVVDAFERETLPKLRRAARVAYFVTEELKNDFPRLPVREGEWAFVVACICANEQDLKQCADSLAEPLLPRELGASLRSREFLRLRPAARSLLR